MAGWYHQCNGYELGQTLGDGKVLEGLVCCSLWGHKGSEITRRLNNNYKDMCEGVPCGSVVKNPPANAGDTGDAGLIPEWGRYPGRGNSNRGAFHRQRSLVDCSPWCCEELATTKHAGAQGDLCGWRRV